MIAWFLCQLMAGGLNAYALETAADTMETPGHSGMAAHSVSGEKYDFPFADAEQINHAYEIQHNNCSASHGCCDLGCQFCLVSCQTVHTQFPNLIGPVVSVHGGNPYLLIVPQSPSGTPFRPPIIL